MSDDRFPVPVRDYEVGYGKPPAATRFSKGVSGNPGGRPRKPKRARTIDTGFGQKAAEEFLRMEAYRPVTIREGENLIELPAIQAVFRAMGVAALKGNRFVQKTLTELVTKVEEQHHQSRMELFGTMVEYKRSWDEAIERARKADLPEPSPVPHPDDIILDPRKGGVQILGPSTKEQKQRLDIAIDRRTQAQEEVSFFAEKYRNARDRKMKQLYLENWHWEQRMFDLLNDLVPGRYKAKLANRSYADGASREGKTLAEFQRNRKLRKQYVGED